MNRTYRQREGLHRQTRLAHSGRNADKHRGWATSTSWLILDITHKQRGWPGHRPADRQTERMDWTQTRRQTERMNWTETSRQIEDGLDTDQQTDRKDGLDTDQQTDRQTDRQTDLSCPVPAQGFPPHVCSASVTAACPPTAGPVHKKYTQ